MITELPVEKLRKICDASRFGCETSQDIGMLDTIIGQDRAIHALKFGLDIPSKGFNIYVAGIPGTGRTTAVRRFLEESAVHQPVPSDWCYVNNFQDSSRPNAIELPPGRALEFQKDIETLVQNGTRQVRNAFESEEYALHRDSVVKSVQQQKQAILEKVGQLAQQEGFVLQATPMGLLTLPLVDGKPMSEETFMQLSKEEQEKLLEKQKKLQEALETAIRQTRLLDKDVTENLRKLDQQVAGYAISHLVNELLEKYQGVPEVNSFIENIRADILENVGQFKGEEEEKPAAVPAVLPQRTLNLRKYQVNVLVDNSTLKGAPVVVEMNPTYANLFGRVEQEAQFGTLVTDFTLIRSGALHRANGGYLVLPVEELLRNPFAWDSLKRALENEEIVIEDVIERLGFTTKSLRPEPIPLELKVVLIGRTDLYQLLLAYDEHFAELFKVKADFDIVMDRTEAREHDYAAFVCGLCELEHLKHLDRFALARLVEHGSRLAGDQEKLSTHFGQLSDLIREASFYASQEQRDYTSDEHIERAIEARYYRSSRIRERLQEMIQRGIIKVDVTGSKVGQINGLSVLDMGDIAFGQPSRITVSIGLGREGLIDIEREAKLGGPIHTKGVLILSGYLAEQFAQDKPLSLAARLVFEQNYSGVEGDSASSTELYAILSALSGLPIRQDIAVTGSVNQKGEVQAIGGVNEKVEGFFETCRLQGLTGSQGVIIPESNVANLMLKPEVVEAVKDGKFHIWAVKTIDEGIEILTGVKAGKRLEDGSFESGSVFERVDRRLRELAETLVSFGKKDSNDKEKGAEE